MNDYIQRYTTADATAPAYKLTAVTPSDTTVLPTTRGLYVGTAGNISVVTNEGSTVTITGALGGVIYPFQVTKVRSTSTTASNILACY